MGSRIVRMILESESRVRLEMTGDGFEIASDDVSISPYHLLAGSLASCIALVVSPWAERAGLDPSLVTISVSWEHVGATDYRVKHMDVDVQWPGLPEARETVVERLAEACPIHATLLAGTEISSRVET